MIVWGLAVIMLGMGITLSVEDFKRALKMPKPVALGFLAQFTIMPALGWSIAHALNLERDLAVGLILVSCCPGGTASNVVAFLARANVALSVVMTICSTMGAVMFTPLLTKALAGALVEVSAWALFLGTAKVVLAPVVIGLVLHHVAPKLTRAVLPVAPLVSVIAIVLICASIIGNNADAVKESAVKLIASVFLLHAGGFSLGYFIAQLFGFEEQVRRTVSIEVGMQNSGLGAALAQSNFAPLTAVPCSISAVFHSVIGSALAGLWRIVRPKEDTNPHATNQTSPPIV
jgi:BASS family bile acid:Na+ symporter